MANQEPVLDLLEPSVKQAAADRWPDALAIEVSIAVSLRRIADALNEPNEYGEIGSAAVAGAIVRGLRQG